MSPHIAAPIAAPPIAAHPIAAPPTAALPAGAALLAVLAAAFAGVWPTGAARAAEQPSAMVESLSQPIAGIAAMDYLAPGQTVSLEGGATLVLDYLASCTRETITGGTVHVGPQQSTVDHGRVSRRRMECDGSDLQLTAAQSDTGGVAVYRALAPSAPALTLRGTMPMIVARGDGPISIERLDTAEPAHDLPAPQAAGGGRATLDLARTDTMLTPGGVYRITQGRRSVVFKIAADAAPGALPLVLRLLPL